VHAIAERVDNSLRLESSTLFVDVRKENKKMASNVKVTIITDALVKTLSYYLVGLESRVSVRTAIII
jgi:hypothetical protein